MKTTQYLYGIEPVELENKFYLEALKYKLESGMKLHKEIYLSNSSYGSEEHNRLFYVQKAIAHTRKLINELEDNQ